MEIFFGPYGKYLVYQTELSDSLSLSLHRRPSHHDTKNPRLIKTPSKSIAAKIAKCSGPTFPDACAMRKIERLIVEAGKRLNYANGSSRGETVMVTVAGKDSSSPSLAV